MEIFMKIEWKNLITCIAIPLAVGALSSLLTKNSMKNFAMLIYGIQLVFNFFWSILFFNLGLCMFAFLWLVLLWLLILLTTVLFYQILKPAGYLMIPYLLWVTFAGYLNLGICLLN